MWVLTVFENNSYRMFEFAKKNEAISALQKYGNHAILSFTN